MNDRIAKKHASQFMAGKREYPVLVEWYSTSTDGDGVYKVMYSLPFKVWKAANKLAYRRGWDGCHWGSPILLAVVEDGELCPPVGGWGEEKLSIAAKAVHGLINTPSLDG